VTTWKEEIASARAESAKRSSEAQSASLDEANRIHERDAALRKYAREVERILHAFDGAGWAGAKHYRLGFQGYRQYFRQLRGQFAISVKIPEALISKGYDERPADSYAAVEFYRYPYDGHRAYVWSGPPSTLFSGPASRVRSGVVEFCGDPRRVLRPEHILSAVARWSVEQEVDLDL
jgi:hypothetical protein